jgi:hypothetical protein
MAKEIQSLKTGIEIVLVAFTDHLAVVLRISSPAQNVSRRQWRWKTDPEAMQNRDLQDNIRSAMEKWRQRQRYYDDIVQWWERCVKAQLQKLICRDAYKRHRDAFLMKNHLYECIYEIMKSNIPEASKFSSLQRHKAKIIRLHATRKAKILLDIHDQDKMDGEEPSLFHVLKTIKCRSAREIHQVQDLQENIHPTPQGVATTFVAHLSRKYGPITVYIRAMSALMTNISTATPTRYADILECPITTEEIFTALRAGPHHKSPGIDGFGLEFYTANWDMIRQDLLQLLNNMFMNNISSRQKHGIIVCLPKGNGDPTPEGYRPISLLTTEYKILARILVCRV